MSDDLIERLRKWSDPTEYERIMCNWDTWRKYIKDGGGGSWPRDAFESLLDAFGQEGSEAADALAAKDTAISEMRAELELARNALEDAEDTLRLVERPAFRDPRYGDEVEALGLRIGFGALMASASASWREHLAADGDPVGGEFVAGPCHGTVVATLAKIRAARALSQDEPADLGVGG